jgi:hypothetical protein
MELAPPLIATLLLTLARVLALLIGIKACLLLYAVFTTKTLGAALLPLPCTALACRPALHFRLSFGQLMGMAIIS